MQKMPSKQRAKHSQDPFLMKPLQRAWVLWPSPHEEESPSSKFHPLQEAKDRWTKAAQSSASLKAETQLERNSSLESSQ